MTADEVAKDIVDAALKVHRPWDPGCWRIDHLVLVEDKTVEKILPIHLAQLLTYLKLSGLSLGLIINWNVILLRDGIQRVVRGHPEELAVGQG